MDQKINIVFYGDPICPTCWGMEPQMKKFILSYGHLFTIKYVMGGLLPYAQDNNLIFINRPTDIAKDWEAKSLQYNMPIDGDLWKEDPLESSYPPAIAFKAAQKQGENKAQIFLRIIREMVFTQKKNITKWKYLSIAATDSGCDLESFKKSYEGSAREEFYEEIRDMKRLGIKIFPTLILSNSLGNSVKLKGYHSFEVLENELMKLYIATKQRNYNKEGISLFDNQRSLTTKEYAELRSISIDQAETVLHRYEKNNKLKSHKTKNGIFWTKNKITIIGGGIAGLTLGNLLEKKHIEYEIFEPFAEQVHFDKESLISDKGIEVLKSILSIEKIAAYGHKIDEYKLLDDQGNALSLKKLPNSFVFTNSKLIELLKIAIPKEKINLGVKLKELSKENLIVNKVLFTGANNKTIFPEIIIAADESKSRIREKLFPNIKLLPNPINEIVSVVKCEKIASLIGNSFIKYTNKEKDLVLGLIQISSKKIAWFIQFNAIKYKEKLDLPTDKKRFTQKYFGGWNAPIYDLLEKTEFSNSILWNENQFEGLVKNQQSNAFFLGNHLSPTLPLTSKSTTESLKDAKLFSDLISVNSIEKQSDIDYLLEQYNSSRGNYFSAENKLSNEKENSPSLELEQKFKALLRS